MKNPWELLSLQPPYVLEIDKKWVQDYQDRIVKRSVRKDTKVEQDEFISRYSLELNACLPFPYYGNPNSAKVLILQANPGVDTLWNIHPYKERILSNDRRNLLHELDIPIPSLSPEQRHWRYNNGQEGHCWYWKRTKEFQDELGWEVVAKSFCYMEFFPYRSISLFYPDTLPPSQQYTFYLLKEFIKKGLPIIVTRMKKKWLEYVPELVNYQYLYTLKSNQNVYLTKKNLGETAYYAIVKSIKAHSS